MDPVITIIISICMSLLFGFAGLHKLKAMAVFRANLDEYELLRRQVSGFVAPLLTVMELVAAMLVLLPAVRITGLVIMAVLLIIYTAGIGINLLRGRRDIDCGCSGPASRHELSGWLVIRNLALAGLVILAIGSIAHRPMNWLDFMVITFSVFVASGLYMAMNQILAQAPRLRALGTSA